MTDTTEIDTDQVDDFLAHFGVKGMHWGQSKAGSGGSTKAPSKSQLIKDDRKSARVELADRDREFKAAKTELKATKRGTPERDAAHKKLSDADEKWAATYQRANQTTVGEDSRGLIAAGVSVGAFVGVKYATNWIANNPDKVIGFLNRNKSTMNAGRKAIGSMGRNLPYAKIAKGVYKVSKV